MGSCDDPPQIRLNIIQAAIYGLFNSIPVFYIAPKYAYMAHINHTLGQCAYKYSTGTDVVEQTTADTEIIFGKEEYNVTVALRNIGDSVNLILKLFGTGVQAIPKNISLLKTKQGRAEIVDGIGQFAAEQIGAALTSAFETRDNYISKQSKLTQQWSLDMFYSISDKASVYAGPGFTNINVVGQCIAQSTTDTNSEGRLISYFAALPEIAECIYGAMSWVFESGAEAVLYYLSGIGSGTAPDAQIMGSGVSPGSVFYVVSAAMLTSIAHGMKSAAAIIRAMMPVIRSIGQSLGQSGGSASVGGTITKNDLKVEAKHTYGSKPMSFMWPTFGITTLNTYTNEGATAEAIVFEQLVNLAGSNNATTVKEFGVTKQIGIATEDLVSSSYNNSSFAKTFSGSLFTVDTRTLGQTQQAVAPANTTVVEGVTAIMPVVPFQNTSIGSSPPVFPPPPIHDYMIDSRWQLGFTAVAGEIVSVVVDDTKLIDGAPSNIVVTDTFCGIASSYTAIEVKRAWDKRYLRPYAVTPDCILLNVNRINSVHQGRAYHSADGQSNRIIKWTGTAGMDKDYLFYQYCFQVNNHFKRSSIFPPSQYMGAFQGPPSIVVRAYDQVANIATSLAQQQNIENNIPGELKDLQRYSIPIHAEPLSSLPAMVRTLGPYKLDVVEGVTSLTTTLRNTQNRYKAPSSIDFNINGNPYRITEEFLCELNMQQGIIAVRDIVASVGLTFIGATTTQAYFYSAATQMYYSFTGGNTITKKDIFTRFKDIQVGRWDFVNQEVMFKALLKDQIVTLRMDDTFVAGEVYPCPPTVARNGDYKLLSMAGGTVYQGPKRFVVNRFNMMDYMIPQINQNKGKWTRASRENYYGHRDYGWVFNGIEHTVTPVNAVFGWTHNAFEMTTGMLGDGEENDNRFEWHITFAWSDHMSQVFGDREYACVNLQGQTATQGGMLESKVTHVYLYKELFERKGSEGYYTFQFQSNNGTGNRERLRMWCDQPIALEDCEIALKQMSSRRTQPLIIQQNVQDKVEL